MAIIVVMIVISIIIIIIFVVIVVIVVLTLMLITLSCWRQSGRRRRQPQKQVLLMAGVHNSCMPEQQLRYSLATHTVVGVHKAILLPCCFRSCHAISLILEISFGVTER